jgi:hypothetical protein
MGLKERINKVEGKVENKTGTTAEEAFRKILDDIAKNWTPLAHVVKNGKTLAPMGYAYPKSFLKSR